MDNEQAAPDVGNKRPLTFHGNAKEFFGIWIVNVLLTVLTLGVYSAWAKVRTNRYFYGSTQLAGDAFSYHARPMQMLIARIIVVSALVVFGVLTSIQPLLYFLFLPVFLFLFPFLVARSLRFQARVSRWRNIGFDFDTDYGQAFVHVILVPLITTMSFGILAPITTKLTQEWAYNRFSFGDRRFSVALPLSALFALFFALVAIGIVALVIFIAAVVPLLSGSADMGEGPATTLLFVAIYGLLILAAVLSLVYRAGVRNIVFNHMLLDLKHRFRSTISKRRFAWIVVSNLIVTALTLGLMHPWAKVRLTRYVASCTYVLPGGPLDDFVESVKETQGVIGEEYVEVESIDIGVGL